MCSDSITRQLSRTVSRTGRDCLVMRLRFCVEFRFLNPSWGATIPHNIPRISSEPKSIVHTRAAKRRTNLSDDILFSVSAVEIISTTHASLYSCESSSTSTLILKVLQFTVFQSVHYLESRFFWAPASPSRYNSGKRRRCVG